MPRGPRLELVGIPLHIVQRGVNRCAIFIDEIDRWRYLMLLRQTTHEHALSIHAYVLMGNHVHLLLSAPRTGVVSQAMRSLGQRYVQGFNRRHQRTGTLWESRFKSSLVDSDRYLLSVYRYIELNPVRAALVEAPEQYRWSSVHANLGLREDPLVTPHPRFLALGPVRALRLSAYREWLGREIDEGELSAIRAHLAQERALGSRRFQAMVEKALNRPAAVRPRGRQSRSRGRRPGKGDGGN